MVFNRQEKKNLGSWPIYQNYITHKLTFVAVYEKGGNIGPGFHTISGNKGAIERQIYIPTYVNF